MKALLLAVAVAAAPLCAQAQPASDDYAQGVALRADGNLAGAAAAFEQATRKHPQDADAWLALGAAYASLRQFDRAEAALAEAGRISPDYLDVQVAQARLAYFREDFSGAETRIAQVLARAPRNTEALDLQAAILRAQADRHFRWRLDVSSNRGAYSRGIQDSSGATVGLSRSFAGRRYAAASLEYVRQFGITDTFYEVELGRGAQYLAFGGTPHADFRPEWRARLGLGEVSRALGKDWTARLGAEASWASYAVGPVRGLHPVLTLAHGDTVSIAVRWINILDEREQYRSGYALRGAWRPAPRVTLTAAWSQAPESSDGRTVSVRSPGLGLAVDVSEALTVRLDAVREERKAYDRDQLSLGLTHRF